MTRYYSFFVTNDEMLASPYVRRFNFLHDLTLQLGKKEEVRFLLQKPLTQRQIDSMKVIYDEASAKVTEVKVRSYHYQTIITAQIEPKELGLIRIGFKFMSTQVPAGTKSHPLHKLQNQKIPKNI